MSNSDKFKDPILFLNTKSSRHHYVPKFLVNGFSNNDDLLYIYDKVKDEIKQIPRSPKSLFFEEHRNTVEIKEGITSSILEDYIYQDIDNKTSKLIKNLQTGSIQDDDLLKPSNIGLFHYFLITLFWRLPFTDYAVNKLFQDAEIISEGIDPEILRNDETFRKLRRPALLIETLKTMGETIPSLFSHAKLRDFVGDSFVIGDNPILYERLPTLFSDIVDLEFIFPVSSKRVFLLTYNDYGSFTDVEAMMYNVLVIDQSKIMVCSGDKKLLERAVLLYKEFVVDDSLIYLRNMIFKKIP